MRFEEALKAMREGKKVIYSKIIHPLFIAEYTNDFGITYKSICWKDDMGYIHYYSIEHSEIFAEDWEVVDE